MTLQILPGANTAWRDSEACKIQAELWLHDKQKLTLMKHVTKLLKRWNITSLLDVGCGSGQYGSALQNIRYVGVDQSEAMITIAQATYPEYEFILGRAEEVNIRETFDAGIIIHVTQHIIQPEDFLRVVFSHFNCKRWIFTLLTAPEANSFNIGDEEAARALTLDEAKLLAHRLAHVEGMTLDKAVGVEQARELLIWTRKE